MTTSPLCSPPYYKSFTSLFRVSFSAVLSSGQLSFTVSIFQSYSILSNGYVPEVGLGQLVGHRQDGQRTVLFWPERLINTTAVDQTPFSALNKHSAKQLLVILAVQLEGLREKRGQNHMETEENRISARFRLWTGLYYYVFCMV